MDKDHISQYNRRYYMEHHDEIAIRRANQRNGNKNIHLSLDSWELIKAHQHGQCLSCYKDKILTPFLMVADDGMSADYIGLCKQCGSRAALDVANRARLKKHAEKIIQPQV